MWNSRGTWTRLAVAAALGAAALPAQDAALDPHSSIKINLPADSPVALLTANVGESRATARGAALVLDLHMGLVLRNASPNRVRGVTLRVVTQEVTLGGKASVAVPSLNVGPGEAFPVRIDVQLMRPTQTASGPLVQVDLDGVLFQDLSFYGPNRLNSRRSLTAWELEAQRDRQHFKDVLASAGPGGLQREMLESLARQAERPRLDVRLARGGRAVSAAAVAPPERTAQFAFLKFPDAPVEPVEGWAQLAGNEAHAPRIEVKNVSGKPVRYVELGWIVGDQKGRQYLAASLPASDPDLFLPPGKTGRVLQDTSLRFSRDGEPVAVQAMAGFISQVEFADGKVWVPNRRSLENAMLLKVLAPSAEEQRLSDLYRKKGLPALIEELRKF
jgi:hypothetical protein